MVRFCRRGAPNWAPTVQNRLKNRLNSKNQAGADSPDAPKSAGKSIGWNGAPEEIRTPDPQIRSLVLYPAELRARNRACMTQAPRSGRDGRPRCGVFPND